MAVASAVSAVTVLNRLGFVSLRTLASTPHGVANGREWQLLTSAFVADRPAVPSVVGFTIVGIAAVALAGARVLWTAAIAGHLLSTVVVYSVLDVAGVTVTRPDYGTSAIIAAWIGVIAFSLWRRGAGFTAVGLCVVAALVGWLLRPESRRPRHGACRRVRDRDLRRGVGAPATTGAASRASGAAQAASRRASSAWERSPGG